MSCKPKANFSLILEGAHLADLIQFQCQSGSRSAVAVESEVGEGYLFFDEGKLMHAVCSHLAGLNAVVEMLRWQGGTARVVRRPWPGVESVGMTANSLLLHAAQREDEQAVLHSGRCAADDPTTCVVRKVEVPEAPPLRACPTAPAKVKVAADVEARHLRAPMIPKAPRVPSFKAVPVASSGAVQGVPQSEGSDHLPSERLRMVKLTSTGSVERRSGAAGQDLVDRVVYARHLLYSLGMAVGAGSCRVAHFRGESEGLLVCLGRTTAGVEGRCEALHPLARKLGVA